jgi:hypothetical protein
MYWSQVTRDSARKREDKRLSVELNADCRRCWLWRICDHGMESEMCCCPIMRRLPDRGISDYHTDHVILEFQASNSE